MALLNTIEELWNAKYRAIDSSRTRYEARLANAQNERQRNFWRRAVERTNARLEAHVATWPLIDELLDPASRSNQKTNHPE